MAEIKRRSVRRGSLAFILVFALSLAVGAATSLVRPTDVAASPRYNRVVSAQAPGYAGSDSCRDCHGDIINLWTGTQHSQAFASPTFQRDWAAEGSDTSCLECHTTGYDPATGKYAEEGIGCEACHGQLQPGHPKQSMPAKPNAELCARCHKQTTDEWHANKNISTGIECEDCLDPHSQTPMAENITTPTEVAASPVSTQAESSQALSYAGSESCKKCHENILNVWTGTRHSQAFSSPIFQRDWAAEGSDLSCLECHTTGYDRASGKFTETGIGCEACHGAFQPNHPQQSMSVKPDAELCARCHKQTTDEWKASVHSGAGIVCEDCHNPHSQTPKAETVTALCSNCHKARGDSFTHGTHANAGLGCSNCHMYTSPRTSSPIKGLVPTGHTFSVGSDACIGCHQDTVHTRDAIIKLSGEVQQFDQANTATLEQQLDVQKQEIVKLKAQSSVRLYTGLTQGAIIGLLTGGAAAWVVSRGIRVIQVEDDEE